MTALPTVLRSRVGSTGLSLLFVLRVMDSDEWFHDTHRRRLVLRNMRRKQASLYPGSRLCRFAMQVALCIGLTKDCDFANSVDWIFQTRRRYSKDLPNDVSHSELLREIEDAFLQLTDDELRLWHDPHTSDWRPSVYVEANRYLRDQALALHVHNINRRKGLTVRSELLPDLANTIHDAAVGDGGLLPSVNPYSETAKRSWGYRWRKRVRGFMGSFGNRPLLTTDQLRLKVSLHKASLASFQINVFICNVSC